MKQRTPDDAATSQQIRDSSFWESDAWIRGVVETAVDAIITIDERGVIDYSNPATERLFGYSPDELRGKNVNVLMPTPYHENHDGYIANYRTTGEKKIIGIGREVMARRKDGSTFHIHLSVSEARISDRRIFTGIIRDITKEKASEQEQGRLMDELRDTNKKITCLYRVSELSRTLHTEGDLFGEVAKLLPMAFENPEVVRARIMFDGTTYANIESGVASAQCLEAPIEISDRKRGLVQVFYEKTGEHSLSEELLKRETRFVEAVAERLVDSINARESALHIIQASKMASIGELAAGVGHEINNPINSVINCADILIDANEPNSKTRNFATMIRSEADRVAIIVRNLLTFSRQHKEGQSLARIADIIESTLALTRKRIAKSHIHLEVEVPDNLPRIRCRSEEIQQVMLNLLLNAIHALDERYPEQYPDKRLVITADKSMEPNGENIRVIVEDYGTGITPSNLDRLFDPFFTTKGRDKGTGLGLSVSDGIIKNHGGEIRVESEHGRYSRFIVCLPINSGTEAGETAHTGEDR